MKKIILFSLIISISLSKIYCDIYSRVNEIVYDQQVFAFWHYDPKFDTREFEYEWQRNPIINNCRWIYFTPDIRSSTDKLCIINGDKTNIYVKKNANLYSLNDFYLEELPYWPERIEIHFYNGELNWWGPYDVGSKRFFNIHYDDDNPVFRISDTKGSFADIELNTSSNAILYFRNDINYLVFDNTTCIYDFTLNGTSSNISGSLIGDALYNIKIEDLVGHRIERVLVVDKTPPQIIAYKDAANKNEFSDSNWINQDLYITYKDTCSRILTINGVKKTDIETYVESYKETGIYNLSATDKAGNAAVKTIKIDKTLPTFETSITYNTEYDPNQNNYKSKIVLNIESIKDEHSGISEISVTPVLNSIIKEIKSVSIGNEKGLNSIENKSFIYDIPDRNTDNFIKFIVTVTDEAGNPQTVTLGGEQGYFVPAAIFTSYEEIEAEKNRVKVNFYRGNTSSRCTTVNYKSIRLKRHFSLTNSKDSAKYDVITENSFGQTNSYWFNTSTKGIWESLTNETGSLTIITKAGECYYKDTAIENSGFTHKNICYDCIYEYTDPVNPAETVTETIRGCTRLAMSNNKGRYSIRVKGEDNTYIVINDKGEIEEGSTESFNMPNTGVVELAVKVEDPDIEEYQVLVHGYAELVCENGKFKLQETDTDPIGTDGGTAGCGETVLENGNKNLFISRNKIMDGNWVELGKYALQYNVTTVLAVVITEGYSGNQEQWTDKTVRLYAKSPSVLGGKARLMVGDAGSYNADGITARPWQPIKMEIVPATENQSLTDLFWDFGNGLTSENCGKYDKKSNTKFENICYEQSPDRTGALSEYKLKIRSGSDEAEFKVNIIDTQWGELLGNEVWRGEHIIKKEIIVPANKTLQIGDTAHSDYDSDITCLCVGKISEEAKGGISVEQGGTLILDEGDDKTIRFVQADFKDDIYCEAAEEDKSWQNMWKGIAVKGLMKGDTLNLRDAACGLTVYPNGSIEFSDLIKIDRCKNGILMNGTSLKSKEIRLNNCSGYGIKLNSALECEKFLLTDNGRGLVLTGNGSFKADNLEIKDCTTGIHLLGGNLILGSGKISGCREYGIKKDTDRSYTYSAFSFEGNERNIYENGIIK